MTYRAVVRAQADAEVNEAADWYAAHDPRLGPEFVQAVVEAFRDIGEHPLRYPRVDKQNRRYLLGRFPSAKFYLVRSREVVVLGCIHQSRHPWHWRNRR